jgi:hypothetical protein
MAMKGRRKLKNTEETCDVSDRAPEAAHMA